MFKYLTLIFITHITSTEIYDNLQLKHQYAEYLQKFNKTLNGDEEYKFRFKIFSNTLNEITEFNKKNIGWKKGLTVFSDLSKLEKDLIIKAGRVQFKGAHTTKWKSILFNKEMKLFHDEFLFIIKDRIDWLEKGFVSKVKNQGLCGSCWAFSALSALESEYLMNGKNITFSEQELVDCSSSYGNDGCNGGLMFRAFDYIMSNLISSDKDYPYKGEDSKCLSIPVDQKFKMLRYYSIENNIIELILSLKLKPISVAFYMPYSLLDYESGIFDPSPDCDDIYEVNHAALLVGVDSEKGVPFLKIKNSLGEEWGEKGFFRMKINDLRSGSCFIAGSNWNSMVEIAKTVSDK